MNSPPPLTFALVHAAWHGPWCWAALARELEQRGHRTVAVDLPCEEPDAGASAYAEVVVDALADEGDDVVLVGHSLGGLSIPLVAERRPVSRLVFVCALLPELGRSWEEQLRDDPEMLAGGFGDGLAVDELRRSYWRDRAAAIQTLYHDVPLAKPSARPPAFAASPAPYSEPCPLARWPDVERVCVVTVDDRVVSPAWSRRAVREWLGTKPTELPGGHSPLLSRPADLARLLT